MTLTDLTAAMWDGRPITITGDTQTVRRVIQLGESTVTPIPPPVPEKRKSR